MTVEPADGFGHTPCDPIYLYLVGAFGLKDADGW
jgi:hypothetical protein